MKKILTVVIPTYNMEKYLRKCLDSLIIEDKELFNTLEVLVVNDGSKDSSSAIAHEYQNKYPEVFRVIDKENGNYGSCVNRGLKEASGKYIKILDADDTFNTSSIKEFVKKLADNVCDLIITDVVEVNESEITKSKWSINYPINEIMSLNDLVKYHKIGLGMHAVTYRTQILRDINYFQPEGISYTDQIWVDEPMAYVQSAVYIPIIIYKYLLGRSGQTMDPRVYVKNIQHHITCAKEMIRIIERTINQPEVARILVWNKAKHTTIDIYKAFLLRFQGLDMLILDDFDNYIKNHNYNFYEDLSKDETASFLGYNYIKNWRRRKLSFMRPLIGFLYHYAEDFYSAYLNRKNRYKS